MHVFRKVCKSSFAGFILVEVSNTHVPIRMVFIGYFIGPYGILMLSKSDGEYFTRSNYNPVFPTCDGTAKGSDEALVCSRFHGIRIGLNADPLGTSDRR